MPGAGSSLGSRLAARLGTTDPFAAMRQCCSRLLDEAGQSALPVRLSAVLSVLDVPVVYDAISAGDRREEASLRVSGDRIELHICREQFRRNPKRARFTIAHEIGHMILYKAIGPDAFELGEESRSAYQEVERYCDHAASHLLIPRERMADGLRRNGFARGPFEKLAALFEVSVEAFLRAMPDLVPDGQLVEWRSYRRHAAEPEVWRAWRCYGPFDPSGGRPWLPKGCTLKHLDPSRVIMDLDADGPVAASNVRIVLRSRASVHDAVACLWPARAPSVGLAFEPGEQSGVDDTTASAAERRMLLLGRRGSVDPGLFSVRSA